MSSKNLFHNALSVVNFKMLFHCSYLFCMQHKFGFFGVLHDYKQWVRYRLITVDSQSMQVICLRSSIYAVVIHLLTYFVCVLTTTIIFGHKLYFGKKFLIVLHILKKIWIQLKKILSINKILSLSSITTGACVQWVYKPLWYNTVQEKQINWRILN